MSSANTDLPLSVVSIPYHMPTIKIGKAVKASAAVKNIDFMRASEFVVIPIRTNRRRLSEKRKVPSLIGWGPFSFKFSLRKVYIIVYLMDFLSIQSRSSVSASGSSFRSCFGLRRDRKKSRRRSLHSSSKTPEVTSGRWL